MKISNGVKVNKFLFAAVITLDQVSKYFIRLHPGNFQIIQNPGLPFAINLPGVFNLVVAVLLFAVFIFCYFKFLENPRTVPGFTLIAAGAVSNIVDRLVRGFAIDFINVWISTINLADAAIMAGIIFLLINSKGKGKLSS